MKINIVGPFTVNAPFATEIAFSQGLRQLGWEVIEFDPNVQTPDVMHADADFTLVFKTALQYNESLLDLKHPVVLYQPDDLMFGHIKNMIEEMRRYSPHLITFRKIDLYHSPEGDLVRRLGFETCNELMVTADPNVYYPLDVEKQFDFCFVGSLGSPSHWHRHKMVELLRKSGYSVIAGQTQNMDEMRAIISSSKVVLNHASGDTIKFGQGYGYQCRHFEAGSMGACVLSNSIDGEDEKEQRVVRNFVRFSNEDEFLLKAKALIDDPLTTEMVGSWLREEIRRHHSPEKRAKELVTILENVG